MVAKASSTKKDKEKMEHVLFLGGHPDEKRLANVFITNFEINSKSYDLETEPNYILLEETTDLIDRNSVEK